MKKSFKLFACLALITSAFSKQPKPPELKISGFTIVQGSFSNQDNSSNGVGGTDPHIGIGASDLVFAASGTATNGLDYMYKLVFETYTGSDPFVKENYVQFTQDSFGTIQAGNVYGPENTMITNGAFIVGGAAGIDGAMDGVYNYSEGVIKGVNYVAQTKRSSKIVWYSPKVSGVQLGFAFTPNTSHAGQEKRSNERVGLIEKGNSSAIYFDKERRPFGTRNITAGISFDKAWGDWSFNLAVVGCSEKTHYRDKVIGIVPMQNGNSYQIGTVVGYDKFKIAAGWIDNRKSRLPKNGDLGPDIIPGDNIGYIGKDRHNGDSGKSWNLGASYTFGAYQVAGAYHRTNTKTSGAGDKTSSNIWVATIDYSVFQGLKVFGEIDYIDTKTNANAIANRQAYEDKKSGYNPNATYPNTTTSKQAIGDNKGTVVTLGTKISF